jgi:predicted Zn finger-like uncharacterized protein
VKISCPTCAAKYSVADEKIQSRLAKIRCRKCSSTIVIDGTANPASVYIGEGSAPISASSPPQDGGAEPAPISARGSGSGSLGSGSLGSGFSERASEPVGPAADEYAVDIADNDQRNMTIHQIVGAYNEGLITADTYIWKEGMADWQTLAEVREVAEALHAAARPGAPAAVRRPGPSKDLFGSIDTAGGENDITTSAPPPMMTAGTGARNESSVLFSLSALTGAPEVSSSSMTAKRGRAAADDSGLIDLQALTSAEATAGAGAYAAPVGGFGASPLISAPLGGVSGPAMGSALVSSYGRRSNRSLVIAAFVLAVGIIGAATVVVKRGGGEEGEPTSALDQEAATAPQRAAAAEPAKPGDEVPEPVNDETKDPIGKDSKDSVKEVAADELPAAAPEPVATPKPAVRAPTPKAPRAPARAKPQPAAPAPAPEPAPVATPKPAPASESADSEKKKKPASRCECKPSDLMCAMRCSAKQR